MSDEQPETTETNENGEQHDAPNQQVVREDGSGPWEEGDGGVAPDEGEPKQPEQQPAPPPEPESDDEE